MFKSESEEANEGGDRNETGEVVVGEVEAVESGGQGRKVAGEGVVREEEELEVGEIGKIGDLALEGVLVEAEHTEVG